MNEILNNWDLHQDSLFERFPFLSKTAVEDVESRAALIEKIAAAHDLTHLEATEALNDFAYIQHLKTNMLDAPSMVKSQVA